MWTGLDCLFHGLGHSAAPQPTDLPVCLLPFLPSLGFFCIMWALILDLKTKLTFTQVSNLVGVNIIIGC
ncbi:unnamed protein product, partial [Linum tenue]